MRVFVAAELPKQILQAAGEIQQQLKACGLSLRWVKPQGMHLTLKFLGEIEPDRLPEAIGAMQQAALFEPSLTLRIQGLGVFPSLRRPRVLWIGLQGAIERLLGLQRRLEDHFAAHGFKREERSFQAHLTLARIAHDTRGEETAQLEQAIDQVGQFAPLAFNLTEMILFKSVLHPQGAIYTRLQNVPLGAG